jgi:hypothetical protein
MEWKDFANLVCDEARTVGVKTQVIGETIELKSGDKWNVIFTNQSDHIEMRERITDKTGTYGKTLTLPYDYAYQGWHKVWKDFWE